MKLIKILSGLLLVVIVLVAIAVFFVANNINGLVKTAVEEAGSDALQTTVSLESVNFELLQGRMQLSGLTIANPSGFQSATIMEMNDIVVHLELASLRDKLVDVKEISVDGLQVVAEQKGVSTNLQALLNNVNSSQSSQDKAEPVEEAGSGPDVLIKIRQLNFTNGSTSLMSDRWGKQDLNLPNINLDNIGGVSGVPPQQLAKQISRPLIKQLIKGLEQAVKELYEGKAKQQLKEKEDELKEKLDSKLEEKLGTDRESLKSLLSR